MRWPKGWKEWLCEILIAATLIAGVAQLYLLYRIYELGGRCYFVGIPGKGGYLQCKP